MMQRPIRNARPRLWRWMIWPLAVILMIAAAAGGWAGLLQWTGNAHEVIRGELYRSARLPAESLTHFIRDNQIRSIINLEGHKPDRDWYVDELAVSVAEGVVHADLAWSASRIVTVEEAETFLELAARLPKPILIHCRSGSDRTGLATALYMDFIALASDAAAEAQLSFRFGHVGIPYTEAFAMDESWSALHYHFENPRHYFLSSGELATHPES